MSAEAEGFAQFVEGRRRALLRTAWLLTGDWALAGPSAQVAAVIRVIFVKGAPGRLAG